MKLQLASGFFISALILAACGGGGSSGGGPTTVTGPSPAPGISAAAPALGEEIAVAINTAMRAGTASAEPPGLGSRLMRLFLPVPLHAQAAFTANCRRGGNVNIRYTGARPVVLAGTSVVFASAYWRSIPSWAAR